MNQNNHLQNAYETSYRSGELQKVTNPLKTKLIKQQDARNHQLKASRTSQQQLNHELEKRFPPTQIETFTLPITSRRLIPPSRTSFPASCFLLDCTTIANNVLLCLSQLHFQSNVNNVANYLISPNNVKNSIESSVLLANYFSGKEEKFHPLL
jgi:hypothetical protein